MGNTSTIPSIYINSYFTVRRFNVLVKQFGYDVVVRNKIERERVIAAMFFITLSIDSKKEYFLRVNNLDGIDAIGAEYEIGSDGRRWEGLHSLEIVEFEDHYKAGLVELVKKKIKKAYPGYFSLICYVNRDVEIEIGSLARSIAELNPRFSSIWIMSNQDGECIAAQIYPVIANFQFNLLESLNNQKDGDFYRTWRGSGKGTQKELGLIELPFGSTLENYNE